MSEKQIKFGKYVNGWRIVAIVAVLAFIAAIVALIVLVVVLKQDIDDLKKNSIPCPASKGGLMTSGDPQTPGPFHDLTMAEHRRVFDFLKKQGKLNLADPEDLQLNTSSLFITDLLQPAKRDVLTFLDDGGEQPAREARVMIFRGDKEPAVVEEYRVGPLSQPAYAELVVNSQRTNPAPFSVRPLGNNELFHIGAQLMPQVDGKAGHILQESYGGNFTDCGDHCLVLYASPLTTGLLGNSSRKIWMLACYPVEYYLLHPVDFGVLLNVDGTDTAQWTVGSVWYSGAFYSSLDDLADRYANDPSISKTQMDYVQNSPDLTSAQRLRGDPRPETPQRPPVQFSLDGKRYAIHHRHVRYLHWDFDLRLSAFTGPQVYDVRFQGERIAYELGLSEIAVFYAGFNPIQRTTNYVDSGVLVGTHSKSLIPGVDCPEDATFLNASFFGQGMREATTLERAQCVFEHNTGVPLRRHMSYARDQGSFYGGMADSVLVVRSILTIVNYDYIVDYVFHQSGAIECRAISTGYIMSSIYGPGEAPYGFQLNDQITGTLHHHLFHFKADLDIGGTSNRYETLDISEERVQLRAVPSTTYNQIRFDRHLYATEDDAVYKYDFDKPVYHIVHNDAKKTKHGVPRSFRVHMAGMSKQLLTPGQNNEKTIPWARQQLAVTVHKDDELVSSSPYAMFDSYNPVTDFSNYINGESIVDKDLVLWVTLGTHHIPHTEDIPVTPTPGAHLSFSLLPYNYFPECPSVSSRDNIRVEYVTANKPAEGLRVERNGNKENQACGARTLEQLVKEHPDHFLQTHKDFKLL